MGKKTRKPTPHPGKDKTVAGHVYADWCGHCQRLKPEWARLKKTLPMHQFVFEDVNSENQDARIAEINHKYGANMSAPQGYPYIFKIKGGKVEEYNDERTTAKLAQWYKGGEAANGHELKKEEVPAPSNTKSTFGKGLFWGGVKTKRARSSHGRRTRGKTQKSLWSQLFS